jgi:hypothetical protein
MNIIFWDMMPFSLTDRHQYFARICCSSYRVKMVPCSLTDRHQYFAGICCLQLQSDDVRCVPSITLGPIYLTTTCHIPEDSDHGTHCHPKFRPFEFHVSGLVQYCYAFFQLFRAHLLHERLNARILY